MTNKSIYNDLINTNDARSMALEYKTLFDEIKKLSKSTANKSDSYTNIDNILETQGKDNETRRNPRRIWCARQITCR